MLKQLLLWVAMGGVYMYEDGEENWALELPQLQIGGTEEFTDVFKPGDIIFGTFGSRAKKTAGDYFVAIRDKYGYLQTMTYSGYMGFLAMGRGYYHDGAMQTEYEVYNPNIENSLRSYSKYPLRFYDQKCFKGALESSRYDPGLYPKASKEDTYRRVSKGSKGLLEYFVLNHDLGRVHFVLDGLRLTEICQKKYSGLWSLWTSHEVRHLHRLALMYPDKVKEKVYCWLDKKRVQLPAKICEKFRDHYKPSLKKIKSQAAVSNPFFSKIGFLGHFCFLPDRSYALVKKHFPNVKPWSITGFMLANLVKQGYR